MNLEIIIGLISLGAVIVTMLFTKQTLNKAKESLKISEDTMKLSLSDSYDNKISKLIVFAYESLDKIESLYEYNEKHKNNNSVKKYTRKDFYKESRFLKNFEAYHIRTLNFKESNTAKFLGSVDNSQRKPNQATS